MFKKNTYKNKVGVGVARRGRGTNILRSPGAGGNSWIRGWGSPDGAAGAAVGAHRGQPGLQDAAGLLALEGGMEGRRDGRTEG